MGKASTRKQEQREARATTPQAPRRREKNVRNGIIASLVLIVLLVGGITASVVAGGKNAQPPIPTAASQLTPALVTPEGAFHVTSAGVVPPTAPTLASVPRVDMFIDPQCPGCGLVERGIGTELSSLVDEDAINLYISPVAFLDNVSSDRYSTRAANAVVTVAEASPEHFLPFVSAIFAEGVQPGEGLQYKAVSDSDLAATAESVGVPTEVAATFAEGRYIKWVEDTTVKQVARKDLFPQGFSTPGVFLNVVYEDGEAVDYRRVIFDNEDVLSTFRSELSAVKGS